MWRNGIPFQLQAFAETNFWKLLLCCYGLLPNLKSLAKMVNGARSGVSFLGALFNCGQSGALCAFESRGTAARLVARLPPSLLLLLHLLWPFPLFYTQIQTLFRVAAV